MKKKLLVRMNVLLGASILGLLGLNNCEGPLVKYGAPLPSEEWEGGDTTVRALYGVPTPEWNWQENAPQSEDKE